MQIKLQRNKLHLTCAMNKNRIEQTKGKAKTYKEGAGGSQQLMSFSQASFPTRQRRYIYPCERRSLPACLRWVRQLK